MESTTDHPADRGFVHVLTFMLPEPQRSNVIKQLNGTRRLNLAMREPGWLDADSPTWDWHS